MCLIRLCGAHYPGIGIAVEHGVKDCSCGSGPPAGSCVQPSGCSTGWLRCWPHRACSIACGSDPRCLAQAADQNVAALANYKACAPQPTPGTGHVTCRMQQLRSSTGRQSWMRSGLSRCRTQGPCSMMRPNLQSSGSRLRRWAYSHSASLEQAGKNASCLPAMLAQLRQLLNCFLT